MEFWNHILNTALLGTDKKQLSPGDLPGQLGDIAKTIFEDPTTSKEEKYLNIAAIAANYRKSGLLPVKLPDIVIEAAAAETLPYCSQIAKQALKDAFDNVCLPLVYQWIRLANQKKCIAPPEMVPQLLDLIKHNEPGNKQIMQVCGKRGEWLSKFNKKWAVELVSTDEELWTHGTDDQRKAVLKRLRETDPQQAREWLAASWNEENAAGKTELLKIMSINLGIEDTPWLESLLGEKSKKVTDEVTALLKMTAESAIMKAYWSVASKAITLKKDRGFLGIGAKTSLEVQFPLETNDAVFQSGIEKQSLDKEFTDEEYVLFQLLEWIPLKRWEEYLELQPAAILSLFGKEPATTKYIKALVTQALRSKNTVWASVILQTGIPYPIELVNLLPEQQREKYFMLNFAHMPEIIIKYAQLYKTEWSLALAELIIKHTATNPYVFTIQFYKDNINRLPLSLIPVIHDMRVDEKYAGRMFESMKDPIIRLIDLKQSITQAFNNS